MKKKKNNSAKEKSKKIIQKNKEEIKISEIEKEVKKAEEEIKNDEEVFEEPIRQIPLSAGAPVLERIIQREAPAQIIEASRESEQKEEKKIDYSPDSQSNYGFERSREDEGKKYESSFTPPVLSRREISTREMKQNFLNPQNERFENRMNETQLNEIDFIENEKKLPFEEQQKKYKRFRLR
jgi:hypothetical protein